MNARRFTIEYVDPTGSGPLVDLDAAARAVLARHGAHVIRAWTQAQPDPIKPDDATQFCLGLAADWPAEDLATAAAVGGYGTGEGAQRARRCRVGDHVALLLARDSSALADQLEAAWAVHYDIQAQHDLGYALLLLVASREPQQSDTG